MKRVTKNDKCSECGGPATITRGDYRFDDMGIPLILRNIEIIKCLECGDTAPVIPHMNELMDTLALAVICQPRKLTGKELRFLRTYLGKSAKDFSALLHLDHTSLSKMENEERPIGKQTDKLVRLLTVNISPELCGKVNQLISMMPSIDDDSRDSPSRISINPATMRYQYA